MGRGRRQLQWRGVWYNFDERTVRSASKCILANGRRCENHQRSGSNQISFGKPYSYGGSRGYAKYKSDECFRSYRQHGTDCGERERSVEHGGDVEFERGRV